MLSLFALLFVLSTPADHLNIIWAVNGSAAALYLPNKLGPKITASFTTS